VGIVFVLFLNVLVKMLVLLSMIGCVRHLLVNKILIIVVCNYFGNYVAIEGSCYGNACGAI
jgi:hypothetical protein